MPYVPVGGPGSNQRWYWGDRGKSPGPLTGGFAPNSANFVKKLIFHECSIPFQVYVETFVPSFIELLLFITIPYFDDIVRESGEAIAQRGAGSRRRRHRHIGLSNLPEPEGKAASAARRGLQTVLRLSQPLETIGYTFLLYAGVERFYYQWNSALYGFEHCGKPPSEGPFQAHGLPTGLPISPAYHDLAMSVVDQNRANWPASDFILAVPRGHYQITYEVTFEPRANNVSGIGLRLNCAFGISFDPLDTGYVAFQPDTPGSLIISAHVYFPALTGGSIQWLYYGDAVPVGVDIPSYSISVFSFQPGR